MRRLRYTIYSEDKSDEQTTRTNKSDKLHGYNRYSIEDEILQSLTVKKLLAHYPSLTVTESFFVLNQTVISGALYGSLDPEDCTLLANHISNKKQGHIQGRIIKLKVNGGQRFMQRLSKNQFQKF